MTKKKYAKSRAEWRKALVEGRVVRANESTTLTSYPTREEAEAACRRINAGGMPAELVQVSLEEQAKSLGFAAVPQAWLDN